VRAARTKLTSLKYYNYRTTVIKLQLRISYLFSMLARIILQTGVVIVASVQCEEVPYTGGTHVVLTFLFVDCQERVGVRGGIHA
jgi:hypothetical protein